MSYPPLGSPEAVDLTERQSRKGLVFHIMYGWYRDASETEMLAWRFLAADFINGKRADVPLTLEDYRAYSAAKHRSDDPGPACHGRAYLDDCPGCVAYWRTVGP